jgi:hypothetical protein
MRIILFPAGHNVFANICFIISISIFQVYKIWSHGYDYTAVSKHHTGWYVKAIGKNRKLISLTITIGVFAYFNPVISCPIGF